jgi:putative tricarboxylic transport membrane protein
VKAPKLRFALDGIIQGSGVKVRRARRAGAWDRIAATPSASRSIAMLIEESFVKKYRRCLQLLLPLCLAGGIGFAPAASAQAWQPQRHVEFIAPAGAGGAMDTFTRAVELLVREMKAVPVSTSVVNKPGGEHAVAYNYLGQKAGDPHVLVLCSPVLLTNHISGVLPVTYTDFTPIAMMMSEYYMFVVNADSAFKSPKDLIAAITQRPDSISLAGGNLPQRMAIGTVFLAANADIKRARIVTISGAKTSLSVAGGHVDVGVAAPGQALPLIEGGKLRALAVGSPKRLGGPLASVPTWVEAGYKDVITGSWRAIIAAKSLTPAQVAYWEEVMRRVAQSPEMRSMAEKRQWELDFAGAAETRKEMEADYSRLKRVMTFMGIVK